MMIERLTGTHAVTLPTGVILDVNGVGYGVEMPLSALCQIGKAGQEVTLWIYTYVREDALKLFGFLSYEDRVAFEILLSLGGVGPKVALAILSTLTVSALKQAAYTEQAHIFEAVPGVGPRLAEKILVELKPKLKKLAAAQVMDPVAPRVGAVAEPLFEGSSNAASGLFEDLQSALENLGFREKAILPLMQKLKQEGSHLDFQELMRRALREIAPVNKPEERKGSVNSPLF